MEKKQIRFSKHALRRARERHLWKYVSKEKFIFDAKYSGPNKAELEKCIYVYLYEGDNIVITTMYQITR